MSISTHSKTDGQLDEDIETHIYSIATEGVAANTNDGAAPMRILSCSGNCAEALAASSTWPAWR